MTEAVRTPLQGSALALVTLALAFGNFMEVLDTTIANVAVPHIAGDLGVSPNEATWVITSYAVANAVSVLLAGWLAQRFGQVRVFIAAVLLFTTASLLCGLAPAFGFLLTARVMQGSVSGLMVPLSQTLLLSSYPRERQGVALAIWGMTIVIAPVVGPILGGWITDHYSWPWIFYINVPVGIAVAFFTHQLLAGRETVTRRVPVDTVGLALIVVWVGALQIMLDKGNELDWFHSPFINTLAVVAALGVSLFLVWELNEAYPIVDLRLFRLRNFRAGTLAVGFGFGVFFANVVLLPLWLQTQMGYTATWAGLAVAPYGVLAFLLSPLVGRNLNRVDPRLFATAAFGIFALANFWRAGYTPDADFVSIALPQLLQGAGIAMFFSPLMAVALGSLDPQRMAFGSGLANFFRTTAGSFGASLVTTFWERREAVHRTQLVDNLSAYSARGSDALAQLRRAAGLTPEQAIAQMNAALTHQTVLLAAADLFWISGWLFVLLIASVWLASKPAGGAVVAAH